MIVINLVASIEPAKQRTTAVCSVAYFDHELDQISGTASPLINETHRENLMEVSRMNKPVEAIAIRLDGDINQNACADEGEAKFQEAQRPIAANDSLWRSVA